MFFIGASKYKKCLYNMCINFNCMFSFIYLDRKDIQWKRMNMVPRSVQSLTERRKIELSDNRGRYLS